MPTLFTRIIEGEVPGRFVWRDDTAVAFLTVNPISPGHTLVVPRVEVDHWVDLDPDLWAHCSEIARVIGTAIQRAFDPPRIGTMVAGFEVPHAHIHVLQISELAEMDFARSDPDPDPADLDAAAEAIRAALTGLGHDPAS